MENQLKIGDVVELKSGGLKMTIDQFSWNPLKGAFKTDSVECFWFEGDALKTGRFNTASLQKI